jgi:hypothetical protein
MRFKKLGDGDVGESESLRHRDPVTGREELNITDADLSMSPPLEEEADARDILPDQIQSFERDGEEEDEDAITARPSEPMRPIRPDDLSDT